MDAYDVLNDYSDYLKVSNMLVWAFRKIMWGVIWLLSRLMDAVDYLLDSIYSLAGFSEDSAVSAFVETNRGAVFAIGAVCLILFFLAYMQNSRKHQLNNLLNNLMLGIGVVLLSLTLTTTLMSSSFEIAKAITSDGGTTAETIMKNNIYDTVAFDANGWSGSDSAPSINNRYSNEALKWLDITEEVDPGKYDFQSEVSTEVFSKKVVNDIDGVPQLVDLEAGWFKIDEHYYRYSWHPFVIVAQLIASIVVVLATSYKYLRSLFNGVFNGIVAPAFAFTDLAEGAKVRKIMTASINIAINIVMFAVSVKMYRMFSTYVSKQDINAFASVVIQIMMALIVLEGPYIIQELTGQEAGVGSSLKGVMATAGVMYAGAKLPGLAKSGAGKVADMAKKPMGAMRSGLAVAGGVTSGAADSALDSLSKEMKEAKQGEATGLKPKPMSSEEMADFKSKVKEDLQAPADEKNPQANDGENQLEKAVSDQELAKADKPNIGQAQDHGDEGTKQADPELAAEQTKADQVLSDGKSETTKVPETVIENQQPLDENRDLAENAKPGLNSVTAPLAKMTNSISGEALVPHGNTGQVLTTRASEGLQAVPGTLAAAGTAASMASQQALRGTAIGLQPAETMAAMATLQSTGAPAVQQMVTQSGAVMAGVLANASVQSATYQNTAMSPQELAPTAVAQAASIPQYSSIPQPGYVSLPQVANLPGVQQFQSDLQAPVLRAETVGEVLANKYADRQIAKAEKNVKYQELHQIGKNTGAKAANKILNRKKKGRENG